MEIAVKQSTFAGDLFDKIRDLGDLCRLSKIEAMLSNCFESMPNSSPVDYVGELNKNDVMH